MMMIMISTKTMPPLFLLLFQCSCLLLLLDTRRLGVVVVVSAQECTADGGACDTHERCPIWKADGECVRSSAYMQTHCPASCEGVRAELADAKLTLTAAAKKKKQGAGSVKCQDRHDHCPQWAQLGECDENSDMMTYCALSCGFCEPLVVKEKEEPCKDLHASCAFWETHGECTNNAPFMKQNCPVSCHSCDEIHAEKAAAATQRLTKEVAVAQKQTMDFGTMQSIDGSRREEVAVRVVKSVAYMQSEQVLELPEQVRTNCQNRNELCAFWAVIGECEKNAGYMKTNCAPSCLTCHLIDMDKRCPKLSNDVDPALHPGDLNKMFERIVRHAPGNRTLDDAERQELAASPSHNTPLYTVHVHSRPDPAATEISAALDKSTPPWVITLDDFLTADECEAMIQLGYKYEYKRSEDVGEKKFDGTHDSVKSERRTSENAWCSSSKGCREEEIPTRLHERMSAIMGIPPENSEDLQLLKYEKGQF